MGYVTEKEVECNNCGRIIHRNELQYDSSQGRICVDCYKAKQPRQATPIQESKASWWDIHIRGSKSLDLFVGLLEADLIISSFATGICVEYGDIFSPTVPLSPFWMILGLFIFFFVVVLGIVVFCWGVFIVVRYLKRVARVVKTDTTEKGGGVPLKSYGFWRKMGMGYEDTGERKATEYDFKVIPLVKKLK